MHLFMDNTQGSGKGVTNPIEVKGGGDKSAPSFKRYLAKNHPLHAVRFSERGYRTDGFVTNILLYLAGKTKELL